MVVGAFDLQRIKYACNAGKAKAASTAYYIAVFEHGGIDSIFLPQIFNVVGEICRPK